MEYFTTSPKILPLYIMKLEYNVFQQLIKIYTMKPA